MALRGSRFGALTRRRFSRTTRRAAGAASALVGLGAVGLAVAASFGAPERVAPATAQTSAPRSSSLEDSVRQALNAARVGRDLAPLAASDALERSARARAAAIAGSDGSAAAWTPSSAAHILSYYAGATTGELVFRGRESLSAGAVVRDWLQRARSRDTLAAPDFTEIGVATRRVRLASGKPGTVVVVDLGARWYLDFATGFGTADVQLSGSREAIAVDPVASQPPLRITAGGYPSETHYARVRWQDVRFDSGKETWIFGEFRLPADFYERQQSYLRLITLDNHNLDPAQTRRLGLVIYGSDHLPRLMRQHAGVEETELAKVERPLPTETNIEVAIHVRISAADGEALTELYLNGVLAVRSDRANVSPGPGEASYTRLGFGIDGAAEQDGQTLELRMGRIGFSDEGPFGQPAD